MREGNNQQDEQQDLISVLSQLTDVMSDSMLEGTITVFVQAGDKELSFNVTTYFVDWEKEVNLPGLGGGGGGS